MAPNTAPMVPTPAPAGSAERKSPVGFRSIRLGGHCTGSQAASNLDPSHRVIMIIVIPPKVTA
ncbi:MAG: hypothetical protein HW416_2363 [Chloroflexi bacterium]|nr:hypothetical protein [Chloroflexota bacterium]